jgi:hypothetical protein
MHICYLDLEYLRIFFTDFFVQNVDVGLGAYKAVPQLLIGKILGASNRGSQAQILKTQKEIKKIKKILRPVTTDLRHKFRKRHSLYVFKVLIPI